MREACYSEAQTDIVRFCKSTHGVLCDACSLRLEKFRMDLELYREENSRLISKLHSVFGLKNSAELAGAPPDEAMALAGFHSPSSSSDHLPAAALHSVLPDDFHLAVNASSSLKEQIARTEKEWKILAERYNDLVEQIQQSEMMLADVRNRNFYLESVNAKLLSKMPLTCKQRSSQVLLNRVMHDQASSTMSVVQVPAERMDEKSPEIWKGSVYTSPTCTFEQKMGIACRENKGPLYSSPVSVLPGESFDIDFFEDSTGAAYNSPAYTFKGKTCSIESGEDLSMFANVRGENEYQRSDLLHAPVATPLAQEVHPPNEAAAMRCVSALFSERDECLVDAFTVENSRMPLGDLQLLNSAGMVSKRQLTSIFDASLHLSEKEGCNQWSPTTSKY